MIMTRPGIIEIPYDDGILTRKGAKEAPKHIIDELRKMRTYSISANRMMPWGIDEIIQEKCAIDPYSKKRSLTMIEDSVYALLTTSICPVIIGGDHSITLPAIRAMKRHMEAREFGLIHFDSHTDMYSPVNHYRYHHGSFLKNILDEQLVKPQNVYQFGIRGITRECGVANIKTYNINSYSVKEFKKNGGCKIDDFVKRTDIPYYVSLDIDVVDPAFAPGTTTPVPGGLGSFEILDLISQLSAYKIIGFDLVEVSPAFDSQNLTVLLAANIICELLSHCEFFKKNEN